MKKLFIAGAMLLSSYVSFGQAVSDMATIPVSVTLNSILRLTVTSGGNIQFVVNTMAQYTGGIANTPGTTTTFSVASSRDFFVTLGAEDASLLGIENAGALDLSYITYGIAAGGGGTGVGRNAGPHTLVQVATPTEIVGSSAAGLGAAAGSGANYIYDITWALAAGVLTENLPADVYVTNVFINLQVGN